MAVTPPPSVTPAPTPAPQRGDKDTFSTRVDAFVVWLTAAVAQFNAIVTNVYNNAVDAFNNATSAASSASSALTSANNASSSANAAAVTTGATLWVSGQTVNQDQAKISPLDRRTYRRKTATGAGTIDPAQDPINYVLLSADSSAYILLPGGVAKVEPGSPVVNIDFLNIFSDTYFKYIIEISGLTASNNSNLAIQFAVNGIVDSSTNYPSGATSFQPTGGLGPISLTLTALDMRTMNAKTLTPGGTWSNLNISSGFRLFRSNGALHTGGTIRVYGIRAE